MFSEKGLGAKRHKFGAKRTSVDGETFPSRLEANLYTHLKIQQVGGYITDLKRHGTVMLSDAKVSYKPDFQAFHVEHSEQVYYEAKGMETDRWRLVKKLWKYYGPGRLFVYKANWKGVYVDEEIIPSGRTSNE